ncbi:MAG: TIGR02757 family protein [Chitinophagaceae bacterium]
MNADKFKIYLEKKVDEYNQPSFILNDPISIPHLFKKKEDIEIAGFFAAIFSWGNRKTIIQKSKDLLQRMDMQPHEFCLHHSKKEIQRLRNFCHRTFNEDDLLYFVEFFRHHYAQNSSLQTAFSKWMKPGDTTVENALIGFRNYFFSLEHLKRTEKHISSPKQKSSCKRLNMYLRWMVRKDDRGVDVGLWKEIKPAQLICPVDVHVARVAKHFGLLKRKQVDWLAAVELTGHLKQFDAADPVKFDFALFGLGAIEAKQNKPNE